MEVHHDEEADDNGDNSDELYAVVRGETMGEVIGDGFIKIGDCGAGEGDCEASEEPAETKSPIHVYNYTRGKGIRQG